MSCLIQFFLHFHDKFYSWGKQSNEKKIVLDSPGELNVIKERVNSFKIWICFDSVTQDLSCKT